MYILIIKKVNFIMLYSICVYVDKSFLYFYKIRGIVYR